MTPATKLKISFGSDNHSGVHPEVLHWLQKVNESTVPSYGGDLYTEAATQKFKDHFGSDIEVFFVWNGTAANVLSLKAAARSYQSVICSNVAHIHLDECGAPEMFTGSKLSLLPHHSGKILLEDAKLAFQGIGDVQSVQPKVISLSQTTEYGTVYDLKETRAFADLIHSHGGYLHMDGARITNAAVALEVSLRELTRDSGVDVLSFGGTKNGLMGAEAIVFFNPKLAEDFKYIRKQSLQLASKMRFVSAQFLAYFENDLWKKSATHANQMAKLLETRLRKASSEIQITHPVQANAVFAILPKPLIERLQQDFNFYVWNAGLNEIRLMCSFATKEEHIDLLVKTISN